MLGGDGEHVTARLQHGTPAGGRDGTGLDQLRHPLGTGLERRPVGHHLDVHLARLLGREVHHVETAAGLIDEVVGTDRREGDVEVLERRHLAHVRAAAVVRPDVVPLVRSAIRQEVQGSPVPHRLAVVGVAVGDVRRRRIGQIEQPDLRRPTTAVAFPRPEIPRLRRVGQDHAVGREHAELAVRDRQFLRQPAGGAHLVKLIEALPPALAGRREEQPLTVRVPVQDPVGHGMMGHADRLAAQCGHDVDIGVAVVVRAER